MNRKKTRSLTHIYLVFISSIVIINFLYMRHSAMSLSTNNINTSTFHTDRASPKKLLESRIRGALWGLFSGDALAAPTHWYYGGYSQVTSDYGRNGIIDYTKPKLHLAGSIMNKSNVNGGGRGSFSFIKLPEGGGKAISIIGDVINHGKRDYWDPQYGIHYHATLEKGENTLEAQLVRVLMKSIVENKGRVNVPHFVQSYINFMTTPGSHNDTYASTCHRMFFTNLVVKKLPPNECPDNDHHNVDTIDGLILPTIATIAVCANGGNAQDARDSAAMVASATRRSKVLEATSRAWSDLIYDVLSIKDNGDNIDLSLSVKKAAKSLGMPSPRDNGRDQMSACYLEDALPTAFDMICKYGKAPDKVWDALIANANSGGENVHRGALLGAALGSQAGVDALQPKMINGLYDRTKLELEIDEFVKAVMSSPMDP